MSELRKAAQAVVERWDTPSWKDVPATAIYIEALRQALAQEEKREWVGLTDEEIHKIVYEQIEGQHPAAGFRVANCIEAKLKEKNT
jgi:hypothetical protein